MKRMIENSPLGNSDKKLTNHSARKTLVKNWGKITSQSLKLLVSLGIILKQVSMRMIVGKRNNSVPYLMLLILLIKILCIFNEAIQNRRSFYQMMNEWRIQLSIFSTKTGLLLNLRIITFITAMLIFTMARILFNTKIITKNVKDVWYIPLILLMNNNFSIFRCVEYRVCYWFFVRLSCYKTVKFER